MSPPSRAWYVVAAAIFVMGLVGFASLLFFTISKIGEGYVRVVVPGEGEVSLEKPGRYVIHHEFKSVVGGRVYSMASGEGLEGMKIEAFALPGNVPVPVHESTMSGTYSFGSYSGTSLMEFDIAQPGRFRVRGTRADGAASPQTVLSIAQSAVGSIVAAVFGCIATLFGSIVLSGGIVAWTLIKRNKAFKEVKGSTA